mgnify:CR=1 FL=1
MPADHQRTWQVARSTQHALRNGESFAVGCDHEGVSRFDPCDKCRGRGSKRERRAFHIKVPAGAESGSEKVVEGQGDDDDVSAIEALIVQRNQARVDKNWALADDARDKLNAMNIILEDSAGKTTWRKK